MQADPRTQQDGAAQRGQTIRHREVRLQPRPAALLRRGHLLLHRRAEDQHVEGGELGLVESWPQYLAVIGPDDGYCDEMSYDWWIASHNTHL